MKLFATMLVVFLAGCGTSRDYKDPFFDPYIDKIIAGCSDRGIESCNVENPEAIRAVKIHFIEDTNTAQGSYTNSIVCGPGSITINAFTWGGITDPEREILVYKAFGECYFHMVTTIDTCDLMSTDTPGAAGCFEDTDVATEMLDKYFNNIV